MSDGLDAEPGALGVIAEYNPFHNGHLYHLETARALARAETAVAVMSGDFVQRGEPALFDKWERAEAAVRNGLDLVVELPFLYACNSAERFAKGAVRLLSAMGCVSHVAFGSEAGEIGPLDSLARLLADEPESFRARLRAASRSGLSFPRARHEAVRAALGDEAADLLKSPNNILAVEYLKQLRLVGGAARIRPLTFKRRGAGYFGASPCDNTAGSSALRGLLLSGRADEAARYMPEAALPRARHGPMGIDGFFPLIACAARVRGADELAETLSASEGLENRLKRALDGASDMASLIAGVKSKRYTETRVKRFLIHVLMNVRKADFSRIDEAGASYFRVLAMNGRGRRLLRRMAGAQGGAAALSSLGRRAPLPWAAEAMLGYDLLAADIYNLVRDGGMAEASDFRRRPYCAAD
ncbi:MAG: nucleotidyltransferase family protein [Clostridiales Family XIII bacterium]|nr:nucleotidyltransferase family protein [Clostridiales Family XIII bacterium]